MPPHNPHPAPPPPADPRPVVRAHGTQACYVHGPYRGAHNEGCRCEPCRAANRAREQAYRQRVAPAYVAAGPARAHLAWLANQGVGLKQVARVSGLPHGSLSKLVYGQNGRPPSRRIRPATAEKILAVTPRDGAAGSRVPATPTWAHITQLLERGWTKTAIARAVGQGGPGLQIGRAWVQRRTARRIEALLDQPVPERHDRWGNTHPTPDQPPTRHGERPPWTALDEQIYTDLAELVEARRAQHTWRKDAACRGRPTWLFHPPRGDWQTLDAARAICAACVVRTQCAAASADEEAGIWAGVSARARRTARQAARQAGREEDREEMVG